MSYTVEKEWLLSKLDDSKIRVIDCRFSLGNRDQGKNDYLEGHLPGAVFFDLEKDLSGIPGTHGGRHPLPDLQQFTAKLERAGIDEKTTIVAYD
ncbi:MAG: rhodanese-like domain-containing protein, partial [Bacillota bacterium]|nr:rhodanese-like domain-containing protein [Bacillota bacterium]